MRRRDEAPYNDHRDDIAREGLGYYNKWRDSYAASDPEVDRRISRKMARRSAEGQAQLWITTPFLRLKITQPLFWWQRRDPERYQVPDWKIMENAHNDWNRAVRIKHGMQETLPGQPSLEQARYRLLCEIIYQKTKEALANERNA